MQAARPRRARKDKQTEIGSIAIKFYRMVLCAPEESIMSRTDDKDSGTEVEEDRKRPSEVLEHIVKNKDASHKIRFAFSPRHNPFLANSSRAVSGSRRVLSTLT